jgi:hypothetical protein
MGHEQRHRGDHPEDALLFSDKHIPVLRCALKDYCWLLSQGYAPPSSLKLVGDKFQLAQRQRLLLMRSACTDEQCHRRINSHRSVANMAGCDLFIDGFNVLITLEHALSGGFLFIGQDGCYRDLASVHGTYKRVLETVDAICLVGKTLSDIQVRRTTWLLDRPVSNSGRLRDLLLDTAKQNGWGWQVELCQSPDGELKKVEGVVVSTDSAILDDVEDWFQLNTQVINRHIAGVRLIDLRATAAI